MNKSKSVLSPWVESNREERGLNGDVYGIRDSVECHKYE